ncbi:outer membrane protein assembly factor BamE [Roseococcus thiosulfatophilus]|uniref:outer membrane protein assembly factor BamE n=1 Tax=Roseococcus thiosulfatophilus TaxID=35813 RepID=UPI001A90710E|nr:outer membrane protein assembly factor BamE [Roseococcus thiosulfatophilus]
MVRPLRMVNLRPALAGLAAGLLLTGCSYLPPLPERPRDVFTTPAINRGHAVTADQLRQVTPGVSTRADVQAALGSPSHTGTFADGEWYYISSVSQVRPARALAVRDQRVVVVAFDGGGTVREVRQVEEREMPRVDFVTRETPTPGTERTIMQTLFGNIGRVGPGTSGMTPQTPGSAGGGSGR